VLGFGRIEPEDGDQTCPQNVLYYISVHTMGKAQKVYEFKFHTLQSEPSRIVIYKYDKLISALTNVTDNIHITERDYHGKNSGLLLLLLSSSECMISFVICPFLSSGHILCTVYSYICYIMQMIVCCSEMYVDFVTGTCVP